MAMVLSDATSRKPGARIGFGLFSLLVLPALSLGVVRFSNVTQQYGVPGSIYLGGQGVCWVDVNHDGRLDLFVSNEEAQGIHAVPDILYINYGTYFRDEAAARGVSDAYPEGTCGAVFADLNRDGQFDLFATTTFKTIAPAFNHIYQNDGNGFFLDITSGIIPAQTINVCPRGAAAADFDGDGDIDLYFSNPLASALSLDIPVLPQPLDNFYINNGDGTFTPAYRGIDLAGLTQGVAACDIDNDGDIDIAEAKRGAPTTIYRNDGQGNFLDVGAEWGLPQTFNEEDNGVAFADVDNDGRLEMAIVSGERLALYKMVGQSFLKYQTIWLWGRGGYHPAFGDFDHDTFLELYLSGENVYDNNGEGRFIPVSASESGLADSLATVDARASGLGDFDNDGDLDIYVADNKSSNLLFRNEADNSDWIQVEIVNDSAGAVGGIGTKLDLYDAGYLGNPAYLRGHREIIGEYGYLAQDMPTAHFGAPSRGGAKYDLKITFLNGKERVFRNIAPGQKLVVSYILPPLHFTGRKIENRALLYRETLIELSWEPNPMNVDVQKYRLYAVDATRVLLAELFADTFLYMIRNVNKSKPYRFAITAVDINNIESQPVYASVNGAASASKIVRQRLLKLLRAKT